MVVLAVAPAKAEAAAKRAVTVSNVRVVEPATGSVRALFTVRLAKTPRTRTTVAYRTAAGTARPGKPCGLTPNAPWASNVSAAKLLGCADFGRREGRLAFRPGRRVRRVAVLVHADAAHDPGERFLMHVGRPRPIARARARRSAAWKPAATGRATIVERRRPPAIAVPDVRHSEAAASPVRVALQLDGISSLGGSVGYELACPSGCPGVMLPPAGARVTIPAAAKDRTVPIIPVHFARDRVDTPDQVVILRLRDAKGFEIGDGAATITVVDDDPPPRPPPAAVSVPDVTVDEGTGTSPTMARVVVTLDRDAPDDMTFRWSTDSMSARSPQDFAGRQGTTTIPRGQRQASVEIAIVADSADEPDETFAVRVSSSSRTTGDRSATVTIRDDDPAPCTDDAYEPDDTVADATLLEEPIGSLGDFVSCLGDPDVVAIEIPAGQEISFAVASDAVDLALDLLNEDGSSYQTIDEAQGDESFTTEALPEPSTLTIRTRGVDGRQGAYAIAWEIYTPEA